PIPCQRVLLLRTRLPPRSRLFPYTTLFRSITDEQKAAITADIDKMVTSKSWQDALATKGWANTYLAGDEFKAQLAGDIEATSTIDRKSTRLNSSHVKISYAVFCLKKKSNQE